MRPSMASRHEPGKSKAAPELGASPPCGLAVRRRRHVLTALACAVAGLLGACSDGGDGEPAVLAPAVEIGVSGGADGLEFVPLVAGDPLYVETFGQGGTHVLFAIRCHGLGQRVFLTVTLTNLETGVQVSSGMTSRPQLLRCLDERTCERSPLLVMMGGIAAPGVDRHGLRVRVGVEAHNEAGLRASAEVEGVLDTERL